ncbi:unnamed protein product [Ilex paraguariensis]|uniref:Calcium-transporting ATPase n=1 Tax=Ilex paraguariensis TaxID=185542 RepID=A0ABC8T6I6_9AQUA
MAPGICHSLHQSSLTKLVESKNIEQLLQFGGVVGVVSALETDSEKGIQGSVEGIGNRRKVFGLNTYTKPHMNTLQIVLEAFKDPIIFILLLCATLSIGFGVKKHGPKGWSDGGSILVAVFLVIIVSCLSNYWPRRHFHKLSRAGYNFPVDVIRNGQTVHILTFDLVVGDVIRLRIGDQVPADGLFMDGQSLHVDESRITGRTNIVEVNCSHNPFLLSGTMVADGCALMVVTSVGLNTAWGEMMSSISCNYIDKTPLQAKLHKLTLFIAKVGMVVAFLVLVVLLIRYFMGRMHDVNGNREFVRGNTSIHHVFNAVVGILATPIAIASAAIPEGLLLAVTITLVFSTKRMAVDQARMRNLSAYKAIGSATVICTNKRGALTLNHMEVTKFWLGQNYVEEGESSLIAPNVRELFCQGVGMNKQEVPSEPPYELSENQIEKAIYDWGVAEMGMDMEELKDICTILRFEDFNSEEEAGILIRKEADNTIHLHQKGAPEVILAMCSQYSEDTGIIKVINKGTREKLEHTVQEMTANGLQCIAFAHKQMPDDNDDGEFHLKLEEESLILLGILGLKYPCRPEVKKAVIDCQQAGVNITMITGDDITTARASAIEYGIIEQNQDNSGKVIDGVEFQNYTNEERREKADKIRVMARASTFHKLLMVQCLKERGHVVAVTGDSKGDALVVMEADIGLSLGIQGTHIAKENSDIVILDDNFVSVARVLRWGKGMYNNIQIFTQFQLTVSIASLVIDFVTAISSSEPPTINIVAAISAGEVPYATLQILWVRLIVGTLASLALTIEKPAEELMQQPPIDRSKPFITNIMWRNIVAQALYQIAILLTIQFKGESIFNVNAKVLIVEFLKRFADTERLNWGQWGACIGIAVVSWPIGWLVKCIPVPKKPFSSYLKGQNLSV